MDITYIESDIRQVARQIINSAKNDIICFYGEMGAGKTTLIKSMLLELGASDAGNSPTFGIVNEYQDLQGKLLAYHFDFYRLNHEMEALDLGFEDYLGQDAWIFIEWPEKIKSLLPEEATNISIDVIDSKSRRITLLD